VKTQALLEASMKLGRAMYETQQASGSGEKQDDGVVDADYEDVSGK
jgi:molecular chaperone DnaK